MLGTRSTAPSTLGEPIKKPWQVVSTSPGLVAELSLHVCDKGHVHTPCAGIDTLRTGFYTPELANVIVRGLIAPPALAKVSAATGGILPSCTPKQLRVLKHKHDHGFALTQPMLDLLSISGSVNTKTGSSSHANSSPPKLPYQAHRPRISDSPLGLVARLLTRADPEYKDPRVAIAMEKQISTLLRNSVWELVPREWSDVKAEARKNGEEVVIGRCFHIVTIKHSERTPEHHEFKVRGVFGGNNARDENGAAKFYSDVSSCPAGIGSARTAVAYAAAVGGGVEAADAEAAYIQSELVGTPTFCILPPNGSAI